MKLSKADKKIYAQGRTAGRKAGEAKAEEAIEEYRGRAMVENGAESFFAWGGQKFLGDMKTPYIMKTIPLHYTVGIPVAILTMWGEQTPTKALIGAGARGLVNGQRAVDGYENKSAMFANMGG
jgi:hypothetical protein